MVKVPVKTSSALANFPIRTKLTGRRLVPRLIHPTRAHCHARRQLDQNFAQPLFPDASQDHLTVAEKESLAQASNDSNRTVAAINQAFLEGTFNLEELLPYRIRVCWRLVREIGRIRGLVRSDESLLDSALTQGTPSNPNPWAIPDSFAADRSIKPGPSPATLDALLRADHIPLQWQSWHYDPDEEAYRPRLGLAVLPPPVPRPLLNSLGEPSERYDPREDEALHLYIELLEHLASSLYIASGSVEDRTLGRLGLLGLLDARHIRETFPSEVQLLAWEEVLIEETLTRIIEHGTPKAREGMWKKHGLQPHELDSLVRIAKARASIRYASDVEEERQLMVLRLEDFVRRSKESFDLRNELAALKQMAVVMGLSRVEADDTMHDFIEVVRKVSDERQPARQIEAKVIDPQESVA